MADAMQPDHESARMRRSSDKTVFIRRLPYDLTDEALEEAVTHIGPVKSCFTVKERDTRKCRGFGYAVFCTREDAEKALQELKHIGGRQVSVSMATRRPRKRRSGKSANAEENQIESGSHADKEDGSISGEEDVEDGGSPSAVESGKGSALRSKSQRTHASTAVGRTLVVTGFPEGVTKKQFYKCCRKLGEVEQLDYPVEGRSELTASVVYKTYPESRKALQKLEGKTFKGAILQAVVLSREGKSPSQKALRKSRLIIRNLSFSATEEDVKSTCAPFGVVNEIKIPRKEGGKKRGFAFVQFSNVFSAGRAMEALNGCEIKGRVVAVDWVVPKDLYETAKDGSALSKEERKEEGEGEGEGEEREAEDVTEELAREHLNDSDSDEDRESGPRSHSDTDDESDMETTDKKENGKYDSRNEMDDSKEDDVTSLESISDDDQEVEEEGEGEGEGDGTEDESDSENELPVSSAAQKSKDQKQAHQSTDVKEGKTVFIRNLPFDCDEEDISDTFAEFGKLVYCRLVINRETDIPKGTAFVKFSRPWEAQKCIEASSMDSKGIVLGGRRLAVSVAVTRLEARSISMSQKEKGGREEDKRNLYLAKEGQINPDSDAAKGLSKADLSKRMKAAKEKKVKLANPNYFVSKTRLSVRNLPTSVDEKQLRKVFLDGAGGHLAGIKQVKVLRDATRQSSSGVSRSRGHGFVEFTAHESAVTALRAVNNNPDLFGPQKRPIVEFAIEDARALKLRADRQLRQKKFRSEMHQTSTQGSNRGGMGPGSKSITPRKRKKDRKGEEGSKAIDGVKWSSQRGKDSKLESTGENQLGPADSVDIATPATKRKKVSRPGPTDGGSKRHTAKSQQPKRKQATKALPKIRSHPELPLRPIAAPVAPSHSSRKGMHRASVPPSKSPQRKPHKRRATEGDMQEQKLNAMIEDYKRKVFGSHG